MLNALSTFTIYIAYLLWSKLGLNVEHWERENLDGKSMT